MSFSDLGLSTQLLSALTDAGYSEPTPIQAQAIPAALQHRDVLGIAQTGTGKTAGFTLPMIDLLAKGRAKARMPRSLILEPTRELAAQVAESFDKYGKYHKLSMALLIGGVSFDEQERKLDRGVDVLIATPGRLLDHMERGKVMLTGVQILVIDEADRMLDMGFIPDIESICKRLPFTRQTMLFSATMPPEIQRLADSFLSAPERIEVARRSSTAETVTQKLLRVPNDPKLKRDALRKLVGTLDVKNGIIFCNRKRDVDILAKSLAKHGYNARPIHGDLDQSVRMKTLEEFRGGELTYLIASDVAARGLDIPDVGHVFNFDVPHHAEDYVHRIGRTGRAGRSGEAYTLVSKADDKSLAAIVTLIGKEIDDMSIEGIDAAAEPAEGERKGRGGRSRGGRRGERSRRTDLIESPSEETAEAEVAAESAEETEDAAPKERKPRRSATRSERTRNERSGESGERKSGRRRGRRREEEDDEPVVGLGDHVPAFLLRETKLPKAKKAA